MVPFRANDGLDLVCVFTQMGYDLSDMTKYHEVQVHVTLSRYVTSNTVAIFLQVKSIIVHYFI